MLLVLAVSAVYFVTKTDNKLNQKDENRVLIYFIDNKNMTLIPESFSIIGSTEEEKISNMFNVFFKGPTTKGLSATVPTGVTIKNITLIDDGTAEVDITNNNTKVNFSDDILFRAALTWSLTGFDFVKNVKIFVNDEEIVSPNNKPIGLLNRNNVLINPKISPKKFIMTNLNLYFSNTDHDKLIKEERAVPVNPDSPIEKYILGQLIAGTKIDGLVSVIPNITKIRDVRTENNICYVDLSKDFIDGLPNDPKAQEQAVYSIVDSLTELNEVTKVQFLIESKKSVGFENGMKLDQTFERNKNLILETKSSEMPTVGTNIGKSIQQNKDDSISSSPKIDIK